MSIRVLIKTRISAYLAFSCKFFYKISIMLSHGCDDFTSNIDFGLTSRGNSIPYGPQ